MNTQRPLLKSVLQSPPKRLRTVERPVNNSARIAKLTRDRDRLKQNRPEFLGIEAEASAQYSEGVQKRTAAIDRLTKETSAGRRKQTQAQNKRALAAKLSQKYHRLNLKHLELRDESGWPKLGFFALTSANCLFSAGWNREGHTVVSSSEPALPRFIRSYYSDVFATLRRLVHSRRLQQAAIRCRFTGVIPDEVKSKIVEAKKDFKTILILAEIPKWSLTLTPERLPVGDPLVVGIAGEEAFLITDFDTTSLEDQVFFSDPDEPVSKPAGKRRSRRH